MRNKTSRSSRSFLASKAAGVGALLGAVAVLGTTSAHAQTFLDITSLTTGTSGSFAGTMGGVNVTGSLSSAPGFFTFAAEGTGAGSSVTDNTSPQYSYSSIYSPASPAVDQVGYTMFGVAGPATITINFSQALIDPVFHIANLDAATFTFAQTGGLTGVSLLSGNGNGADGLTMSGSFQIRDVIPAGIGIDPSVPPPTTGNRSGYGSVQLTGAITSLTINIAHNPSAPGGGDGGSFTISTSSPLNTAAPEPGSLALLLPAFGVAGMVIRKRRQKK